MNSGEKILQSIREESSERIRQINADADKYYDEMMEEAQKKAGDIRSSAEHRVQLQSEKLVKAHKSRAELERRNSLLKTRRDEIKKALEASRQYMLGLDDKQYFELVIKLAEKLSGKSGTVFFNSRDLKRLPAGMKEKLSKSGLDADISSAADDSIDGGFILKSGDIEENMSFSSLIAEKKEQLEDMISKELFND